MNVSAGRDFDDFRRQMPVTRYWSYFDHAAVAPLPEETNAAITAWADDAMRHGDAHWLEWSRKVEETRRLSARLLGANIENVALLRNTTEGISAVAEGFPWREGDNVVTLANEFPSNLYPWMNLASRGVETRRVPVEGGKVDLAQLAAACDARTRIVSVSWVGYASGWRNDVADLVELAHSKGALLFLDAIQGLGVFPIDVKETPVDFLAADGHKWLLGPEGAGLFYLRSEHLDLLRPVGVGWNSVVQNDFSHVELKLKPTAGRYEGGTFPVAGMVGLGASLELLARYDPHALADRVVAVSEQAVQQLASAGAVIQSNREKNHASGIVAFDWPGENPTAVRQRCLDRGVALSARGGHLRISPHAYNNLDDIERLVAALVG